MITIVQITKEESFKMREKFSDVAITITNRQSSHKKYYMEERRECLKYLASLRRAEGTCSK